MEKLGDYCYNVANAAAGSTPPPRLAGSR